METRPSDRGLVIEIGHYLVNDLGSDPGWHRALNYKLREFDRFHMQDYHNRKIGASKNCRKGDYHAIRS